MIRLQLWIWACRCNFYDTFTPITQRLATNEFVYPMCPKAYGLSFNRHFCYPGMYVESKYLLLKIHKKLHENCERASKYKWFSINILKPFMRVENSKRDLSMNPFFTEKFAIASDTGFLYWMSTQVSNNIISMCVCARVDTKFPQVTNKLCAPAKLIVNDGRNVTTWPVKRLCKSS